MIGASLFMVRGVNNQFDGAQRTGHTIGRMPEKRNDNLRDSASPSADPCTAPHVDVGSWAEGALTQACAMRLPPWLRLRHTSLQEESIPSLLLWWLSHDAETQAEEWIAAWLYAEPRFPDAAHPA